MPGDIFTALVESRERRRILGWMGGGMITILIILIFGVLVWRAFGQIRMSRLNGDPIQNVLATELARVGQDIMYMPEALTIFVRLSAENEWSRRDVSDRIVHALKSIERMVPAPVYKQAVDFGRSLVVHYEAPR